MTRSITTRTTRTLIVILFMVITLVSSVQAEPLQGLDQVPDLGASTPQLIKAALTRGQIDQDAANLYLAYALADFEKLPAQYHSTTPWHGTLPLLHLRESVKAMAAGASRTTIEELLTGSCGSSSSALPNVTNTSHFHVEYGTIGGGLAIGNDTASLETTWDTEVTSFGWAAPPVLAGNPPPGNLYHVRVDNLGSSLYGYVTNGGDHAGLVGNNPNTTWNDVDAYATCMVMNNDYSGFPGTSQAALDATTAHEFNHSIQFGYGALHGSNAPDDSLVEGGATWMEDEVFDSADDNHNYLWPTFEMCMGEYTAYPYPYWITLRGLTERYGTGAAGAGEEVMQDFWEETSKGTGDNLSALSTALVNQGTTLAEAYHAYAVAVKFNKPCAGGYVYPHCLEEGADYVSAAGATSVHGAIAAVEGSYTGSLADNYALNWISLPSSGATYSVTLENTSSGGQLRGSVVCDTGSALTVSPLPAVVSAGNSSTLAGFNPAPCSSVVAVITNQSQTANNPSSCTARSYKLSTSTGGSASSDADIFLPLTVKSFPVPTPLPTQLVNGDFESGPTGWDEYSSHGWPLIVQDFSPTGVTPHGGTWAVWLGGGLDELSYIQQQVTVPASAPYLAYWHWIGSEDLCGYDFGLVVVGGSTIVDFYTLCADENTGGWVKHVVNLGAYAGQSISLQIRAETDYSGNSNLFVDDVSFQSSATSARESLVPVGPDASVPRGEGGEGATDVEFLLRQETR